MRLVKKFVDLAFSRRPQRVPKYPTNDTPMTIYADLFGPYPFSSIGQSKYFVCYSDDASGYLATYFLKSQKSSEIVSSLNDFITHLGKGCIPRLRTDNAKYWHGDMRNFCQTHNIQQEFSPPYSHQSAGSAERAIGKITQLCGKLSLAYT